MAVELSLSAAGLSVADRTMVNGDAGVFELLVYVDMFLPYKQLGHNEPKISIVR